MSRSAIAIPKPIGLQETGLWSVVILAVAFWANILRGSAPDDLPGLAPMITRVLDNGAFDVFAWGLIFVRSSRMFAAGPASWARIATVFGIGVIALAPVRLAPGIGLAILGVSLLRDRAAQPAGRQAGLIMLGLALETLWESRFLSGLHILVARADAVIVGDLFRMIGIPAAVSGNVVENLDNGFSIVIWPYCASSMQLAGFVLAFLVMCLYLGRMPRRSDLRWLGLGVIGSIILTECRLVLLGLNESSYHWWHEGPGISIYTVAALGLAVLVPVLATRDRPQPPAAPSPGHP
ncbi:MAG TPA: hypothetical protein VHB27_09255 [Rhodopila sp.]|uniref:hypothetical protein n=1 Tax=Rhodopila sp. TaxID=2480087 RepID=UPI002BF55C2B|nr:hypothetical protein [Rhodopila sp.]HVY15404.1 hypothetical protein [Rhodopila sp.]